MPQDPHRGSVFHTLYYDFPPNIVSFDTAVCIYLEWTITILCSVRSDAHKPLKISEENPTKFMHMHIMLFLTWQRGMVEWDQPSFLAMLDLKIQTVYYAPSQVM